jgi:SAM-dependent methyltransferase
MDADGALDLGRDLQAGARHYRAFVGPPGRYDVLAALQFNLLTALGLREEHSLLDIGCGSCRAGRLFLAYLLPGRYCGLEPEAWLVEEGLERELGRDVVRVKRPTFRHDRNFALAAFGRSFDFLLSQSVFSHAPALQVRRCLSQARQVMKPDAVLAATYKPGDADHAGAEWVYPACVSYTPAFFQRMVEDEGLACVPIDWPHPGHQQWVLIVHPGAEKDLPPLPAVGLSDELARCRARLARMEGHPVVRLGLAVRRLLRRVTKRRTDG